MLVHKYGGNMPVVLESNKPEDKVKWQAFCTSAFNAAGLPEVPESELETGTYTNAQIAGKLHDNPTKLLQLLMGVSQLGSAVEKRSILSFAVDMVEKDS